ICLGQSQIFFQADSLFGDDLGMVGGDIPEVPRLVVHAGLLGLVLGIPQNKAVVSGVFQQPLVFLGLGKVHAGSAGGAVGKVHRQPQAVLALPIGRLLPAGQLLGLFFGVILVQILPHL